MSNDYFPFIENKTLPIYWIVLFNYTKSKISQNFSSTFEESCTNLGQHFCYTVEKQRAKTMRVSATTWSRARATELNAITRRWGAEGEKKKIQMQQREPKKGDSCSTTLICASKPAAPLPRPIHQLRVSLPVHTMCTPPTNCLTC